MTAQEEAEGICSKCEAAGRKGRRKTDPHAECPPCLGWVEHHPPGDVDLCWQGKARMARARRDAGLSLDAVDRLALERWPDG